MRHALRLASHLLATRHGSVRRFHVVPRILAPIRIDPERLPDNLRAAWTNGQIKGVVTHRSRRDAAPSVLAAYRRRIRYHARPRLLKAKRRRPVTSILRKRSL
jgi:hypothetical protein